MVLVLFVPLVLVLMFVLVLVPGVFLLLVLLVLLFSDKVASWHEGRRWGWRLLNGQRGDLSARMGSGRGRRECFEARTRRGFYLCPWEEGTRHQQGGEEAY